MKVLQKYLGFITAARRKFQSSKPNDNSEESQGTNGKVDQEPANFETAIEATGFGKFNMLLLLVALPSGVAGLFATSTMSFVVPIAECDLNLTLGSKGTLNAVTYLGMITSGFFWAYLSDTFGRKKLLSTGYILNGLLVMLSGLSQHYIMLLVSKFFEGFIINGPYATLIAYLNEFHCAKYRSILPSVNGIIYSIANITLPLLGWLILTKPVYISIFDGFIILRSWNIFLLVCSIPSLTAGFAFILLPESPKFEMTVGNNESAYKTFQKIYAWNSGTSQEKYPISSLAQEMDSTGNTDVIGKSNSQALKDGWKQVMPLFHRPFLGKILLLATIQTLTMTGSNTLRLWLPQIFAAISNYQNLHQDSNDGGSLCAMLELLRPNETLKNITCVVNYNMDSPYTNNIIVALVSIGFYLAAATRLIGKKITLASAACVGGICSICMYFAQSETAVVALSAVCISLAGVSLNMAISIVVDIFPTTLRTMTVAITLVSGRCGAMAGNLVFPILLTAGCFPPFITVGALMIGGAILCLALPTTDKKELE